MAELEQCLKLRDVAISWLWEGLDSMSPVKGSSYCVFLMFLLSWLLYSGLMIGGYEAAIFVQLDEEDQVDSFENLVVPWYLPAGINLAYSLLLGPLVLPSIFLTSVVLEWYYEIISLSIPLLTNWCFWKALCCVSSAVILRALGTRLTLTTYSDLCYIVLVTLIQSLMLTLMFNYVFVKNTHINFYTSLRDWFLADCAGVLIVVPFFFCGLRSIFTIPEYRSMVMYQFRKLSTWLNLLYYFCELTAVLAFTYESADTPRFYFAAFPVFIALIEFGLPGGSTALSVYVLVLVLVGKALDVPHVNTLELQMFLVVSCFSVLWVGIKLDKNLQKLEARFQSFNSVRTFRFADKFIRRPGSYHYMEDEIDDINAPQNDNLTNDTLMTANMSNQSLISAVESEEFPPFPPEPHGPPPAEAFQRRQECAKRSASEPGAHWGGVAHL